MSIECVHQEALECRMGTSDKLYVVQVQKRDMGTAGIEYLTVGYHGRRGATLSRAEKYKGPSLADARAKADKLARDKRMGASRYTTHATTPGVPVTGMPSSAPVPGAASVPSSAAVPAAAIPTPGPDSYLPMLAETVKDADELELLLSSPDWVAQRKYDGERALISVRRSGCVATNRKGLVRPLTDATLSSFTLIRAKRDFSDEREAVLDGELMGEVFVAYDMLFMRSQDFRDLAFDERYASMELLLAEAPGLLAPTAWTEKDKRAMLEQALLENWEGLIFRNVNGTYVSARVDVLKKYKLWSTVTCRVMTINKQRSIGLGLRDADDGEVFVGNVTVPPNQNIPKLDSLVEVRYLYAMDEGSLYQPVLLRSRSDVDEADLRSSLKQAPPEKRGEFPGNPAQAENTKDAPAIEQEPALS